NPRLPSLLLTPRRPALFPYTTLFRSRDWESRLWDEIVDLDTEDYLLSGTREPLDSRTVSALLARAQRDGQWACNTHEMRNTWLRSEEHTSELQSREKLVCRLLLEKKK